LHHGLEVAGLKEWLLEVRGAGHGSRRRKTVERLSESARSGSREGMVLEVVPHEQADDDERLRSGSSRKRNGVGSRKVRLSRIDAAAERRLMRPKNSEI